MLLLDDVSENSQMQCLIDKLVEIIIYNIITCVCASVRVMVVGGQLKPFDPKS